MKPINNLLGVFAFVALIVAQNSSSEVLKDPINRDEDISNTAVSVKVNALDNGFYEYIYDVESSSENKGRILSFAVDLYCKTPDPVLPFPESADQYFKDFLGDNKDYVSAQVYSVHQQAGAPSITTGHQAAWMITQKPGEYARGMRILSAAPPGNREYELLPSIKWIPDFTVRGLTKGPACPGQEDNFLGSNDWDKESLELNSLLSYSAPTVDQFHVGKGVSQISMTIHYAVNIDPKTFKVTPAHYKKYFTANPGTSQSISLPLKKKGKHLNLKLEVRAVASKKGKDKSDLDKHKDKDVFVIRTDS